MPVHQGLTLSLIRMRYLRFCSLTIVVLFCYLACADKQDNLVTIDSEKNYPTLDLIVSDLAEISYVKLGGAEEGIIVNGGSSQICIDESRGLIIIGETTKRVHVSVFDLEGHFLRSIGREGRGPGEFIDIFNLVYDSENDIINIFCPHKTIRYTSQGNYLGEVSRSGLHVFGLYFVQDSSIVYFNDHSTYIDINGKRRENGRTLTLFDKRSLEELPLEDHHYSKIWESGKYKDFPYGNTMYATGNVCYTDGGYLITSSRSDTTYLFNRNRQMIPFMLDVRHNAEREYLLTPTVDSREYLFVILSARNGEWPIGNKYYAIRKHDKKVFSCGESYFYRFAYREKFYFGNGDRVQNPGYVISYIHRYDLDEAKNKGQEFPKEVQLLSEGLAEDSNPILMLVKFKTTY